MAGGFPGAGAGLAAGVGGALALRQLLGRRTATRRAAVALPFPEKWRAFLLDRYDHFERLDPRWRARFEDDVRIFLAEKRITGVGVEATDELRLLVAASAVTLSVGWPEYEWDHLTEVLLYPDDFDRDYAFGGDERSGEAHPWGTVILSVPSLLESFEVPDDAYHVGIHEFAHLLDVDQTHFDGIPVGLHGERARAVGGGRRKGDGAAEARPLGVRRVRRPRRGRVPRGGGGGVLRDPAGGASPPPRGLRDTLVVLRPGPRGLGRRAGSPGVAMRLDLLLIRRHPELSRRKAREVIEKGQVSVDGASVREAGREVPESAKVAFDPNRKALPRARCTLGVLYEDEHVIVVDKPAGLLTVPSAPGVHDEDTALPGCRTTPSA